MAREGSKLFNCQSPAERLSDLPPEKALFKIKVKVSGRTQLLGSVLSFLPDLVISWGAMRLTDSGWSGFFITLVVLRGVYFCVWLRTELWTWLLFWTHSKEGMAGALELEFIHSRFPLPDRRTHCAEDYYAGIANNEKLAGVPRVRAAFLLGTVAGLRLGSRFSLVSQVNSAGELAMKRYAKHLRAQV
jgi:hypothetical protein